MKLKKKYKKRLNKIFIILIIIIVAIGAFWYFKKDKQSNKPNSKIDTMMKEKDINSDNYSKTLEYVLLNNIYNEKYLKEYKDIEFNNQSNFSEIITSFLPKGYSGKEINYLFNLSDKNINYLKEHDYADIKNYYSYKNFDAGKIKRYNDYKEKNNSYSYKDIITYVNIKMDLPVYTDTVEVNDANSLLVLVNKYNHLPKNYKPSDIEYVDGAYSNKVPMRKITKEAFLKLKEVAKEEGKMNLMPSTAFRDEAFQASLYNKYVASDGVTAADTYSARPGYSEHQTGLSIDLRNIDLGTTGKRLTDENFKWLSDNAYRFGFIIRFPKDKEHITGYQFENWHIRYVGEDIAKIIHDEDLTLEEYIDLYITKY